MIDVRRQDVGTDVVYLPKRNLLVLHPDLNYGESLAAILTVIPDLHLDVAKRLVEKVNPRLKPEPRRWPMIALRMGLAALASAAAVLFIGPTMASAEPEFGPDWQAAVGALGMECHGDREERRLCRYSEGEPWFSMRGFRHESGSLYVSDGPYAKVIFVFDEERDAVRYVTLHPAAERYDRAVVW